MAHLEAMQSKWASLGCIIWAVLRASSKINSVPKYTKMYTSSFYKKMFKKDLPTSAKKILKLDVRIINSLLCPNLIKIFFLSVQSFPGYEKWAK